MSRTKIKLMNLSKENLDLGKEEGQRQRRELQMERGKEEIWNNNKETPL